MSALGFRIAVAYTAAWMLACSAALAIAARRWRELAPLTAGYWRFLCVPWKLATIAVAVASLVVLAPHAHDPSWDRVDATVMSLATFTTAPWVVGVLDRRRRGQVDGALTYVAVCTMMLSASWFYDLYLFVRDGGVYPKTWLGNLFVGPLLYLGGGVFWSLDLLVPRGAPLARFALPALALMALATCAFLPYLVKWP